MDNQPVNYVTLVNDEDGYTNLFFNERHVDSFSPGEPSRMKVDLTNLADDLAAAHNTRAQHFSLDRATVKNIFGNGEELMYDGARIIPWLKAQGHLQPIAIKPMSQTDSVIHYLTNPGDVFYDADQHRDIRASIRIDKVQESMSEAVEIIRQQSALLSRMLDGKDIFASAVQKLVDYRYDDERRHWDESGRPDVHIFHAIRLMGDAAPVTLRKVMTTPKILAALTELVKYDRKSEARDFAEHCDIEGDPEQMKTSDIIQPEASDFSLELVHAYQLIRLISSDLDILNDADTLTHKANVAETAAQQPRKMKPRGA